MKCLACNSVEMSTVLSLGNYYPANTQSLKKKMSLEVVVCKFCTTAQIPYRFEKEVNFPPEYPFRSGITKALRDNFQQLSETIDQLIPKESKILEIGSNDGTLLSILRQKKFKVLGVEPTLAAIDTPSQIPVIRGFFEESNFNETFDCIVLTNTFAHLSNQVNTLKRIREVLVPDGFLILEVVDLEQILNLNEFDKFTHEHGIYFDHNTLRNFMGSQGFSEITIEKIDTHGGSLRGVFKFTGEITPIKKFDILPVINHFLALKDKIDVIKLQLPLVLKELSTSDSMLFLAGATTRGEILVNALQLDKGSFRAVLENPKSMRIGTKMANLEIEVVKDDYISTVDSPIVLILAWHVHNEVIESLKRANPSVKCVIPLPEIRVV